MENDLLLSIMNVLLAILLYADLQVVHNGAEFIFNMDSIRNGSNKSNHSCFSVVVHPTIVGAS